MTPMTDPRRDDAKRTLKPALQFLVAGASLIIGVTISALLLQLPDAVRGIAQPLLTIMLVLGVVLWALSIWRLALTDRLPRPSPGAPAAVIAAGALAAIALVWTGSDRLGTTTGAASLGPLALWSAGLATAFAAAGLAASALLRRRPR